MANTGDRYVGEFDGHTIELVRNNWVHTLKLAIDGVVVDQQSCHFPRTIRLTGILNSGTKSHQMVATSTPRYWFWAKDIIEVDENELPVTKIK